MDDPYRPSPEADVIPPRVLAGPSFGHRALPFGLSFGLLAASVWVFTSKFFGEDSSLLTAAVLLALACVAILVTINKLRVPHRVLVDSRGIELSWGWEPSMEGDGDAIAWDELSKIVTKTTSRGRVSTSILELHLDDGEVVEIPDGLYNVTAAALQTALLDEMDDRLQAPRRAAADVAGYCRDLYAKQPLELHARLDRERVQGWLFVGFLMIAPLCLSLYIGDWTTYWPIAAIGLALGSFVGWAQWTTRSPKLLRLSKEGFGYSHDQPDQLEWVPWTDIRFARPHVQNGKTIAVRVARRGGVDIELRGDYGIALRELACAISPPIELVEQARQVD